MFFTRVGVVVAWLALLLGASRFAMGMLVAFKLYPAEFEASRYLGSTTPGEAVNQGLLVLLIAIALGILTEISRSLRKNADEPSER
jgi:hypothetical protein